MSWSKKRLEQSNLYLILDSQVLSYKELLAKLKPAICFGVDIVQLRDKNGSARDILDFSKRARKILAGKALFILNDRVDLSLLAGADGVHLGQEDIPYVQARAMMGSSAIIGVSCQKKEQAESVQALGADYIGFGSIFKTQTKPERQPMNLKDFKEVIKTIKIPIFPIGGICLSNLDKVIAQGSKRVAVCRDILMAQNVGKVVREFKNKLRG